MKYAAFMRNAVAGYFEVVSSRVKKNGMHMNNANPVISNKDSAYSILFLGIIMLLHSFGFHIPEWVSPVTTFAVIGYFFLKSKKLLKLNGTANPA